MGGGEEARGEQTACACAWRTRRGTNTTSEPRLPVAALACCQRTVGWSEEAGGNGGGMEGERARRIERERERERENGNFQRFWRWLHSPSQRLHDNL